MSELESSLKRRPPRRGRLTSRILLHLAAFVPLYAMLAWRLFCTNWFLVFFALTALGCIAIIYTLAGAAIQEGEPFDFDDITDVGDQVADQVVGYLLPLLVDGHAANAEVWVTTIILFVLALILIQSNRVHLNPVFFFFGFRVYTATSNGIAYYLLARSDLSDLQEKLIAADIPGGLLVEKGRRR